MTNSKTTTKVIDFTSSSGVKFTFKQVSVSSLRYPYWVLLRDNEVVDQSYCYIDLISLALPHPDQFGDRVRLSNQINSALH